MQFLHLVLTCVALASTDDEVTTPQPTAAPSAREVRLNAMSARLEARLAEPYDKERLKFTLEEVSRHLIRLAENYEPEVDFGEQTLLAAELRAYRSWNRPMLNGALTTPIQNFEDPKNPIHTILKYGKALSERGIDLLVVPIPTRLDLYPERLPSIARETAYRGGNRGMARFMLELTRQGVEVVDLYEVFGRNLYSDDPVDDSELYFQREYHWTQRAVELAAGTITAAITDRESFVPGSLKEGTDFLIRKERGPWDIITASGIESVELLFRNVEKQDGSRAFIRDRESDILILGDSFTVLFRDHNSDLTSQIFARLKRPLDQIAMSGGGAERVWKTVARRKTKLSGKKLVVWQFTSRNLTDGSFQAVKVFEN